MAHKHKITDRLGEIGILQLPATFANAHGLPSGDRIRGQPHSDIASLDQRSVVCRPIPAVVFCLVLWVHSRLHVEIMHLLSPRWPGGRPWLTEGAGSVHQRPAPPAAGIHATTPHSGVVSRRRSPPRTTTTSHRRVERGPDCRPPSSQRGTSSCTWDGPSTSSLQCGSCGGSREVRATPPHPQRVFMQQRRCAGARAGRPVPCRCVQHVPTVALSS